MACDPRGLRFSEFPSEFRIDSSALAHAVLRATAGARGVIDKKRKSAGPEVRRSLNELIYVGAELRDQKQLVQLFCCATTKIWFTWPEPRVVFVYALRTGVVGKVGNPRPVASAVVQTPIGAAVSAAQVPVGTPAPQ